MIFCLILATVILYFCAAWHAQCRKNRMLCLPKKLDMINLGSTYAFYDFSYEGAGLSGGNLANVPQYLDMDRILLKKYIKRVKLDGKVLIILPDFVFASPGGSYNRNVYFEALHIWEIPDFRVAMLVESIWKAAKEPVTHSYRKAEQKWKGYTASRKEKEMHAKNRVADWEGKLLIPSVTSSEITEELSKRINDNMNVVCDMIDICRDRGAEPILLIPPVSEIMHDAVSEKCLDVYLREPVKKIIEQKQVRMFDYENEEALSDADLYLNSDCLNEKGREIFMKLVLRDVYGNG